MKTWLLALTAALTVTACGGSSSTSPQSLGEGVYERCRDFSAADKPLSLRNSELQWPEFASLDVLSGDISDQWILKGTVSSTAWTCMIDDKSGASKIFWGEQSDEVPLIWWKAKSFLSPSSGGSNQPGTNSGSRPVVLQIVGSTGLVDVTIGVDSQISQFSGAPVPFQRSATVPAGTFVQIIGQNVASSGTVTCQILQGGKVLAQQSSSGAYVIASCSATSG